MDESLCSVHADVSGRPFLVFRGTLSQERVGDFDTCMTSEFLRAFATNAGIDTMRKFCMEKNAHHEIEGIFKALGHALHEAVSMMEPLIDKRKVRLLKMDFIMEKR